jgi:hypothetical protein
MLCQCYHTRRHWATGWWLLRVLLGVIMAAGNINRTCWDIAETDCRETKQETKAVEKQRRNKNREECVIETVGRNRDCEHLRTKQKKRKGCVMWQMEACATAAEGCVPSTMCDKRSVWMRNKKMGLAKWKRSIWGPQNRRWSRVFREHGHGSILSLLSVWGVLPTATCR